MWDITHKKIDGSYVNEKAKEIAVRLKCNKRRLKHIAANKWWNQPLILLLMLLEQFLGKNILVVFEV
ncbi:hypothetical protein Ahy_B05g076597 isoform B [Arachis hypogaea]|uniref:GP-PDE domain-containing protein n=1 Tax=Arachis hypogaea TaxID=3818 RepID=A0A444Z3N0_ARAHY|nr:hypothetical protein Ahy_B05g076597 isoform B [Arachis hypogaea]